MRATAFASVTFFTVTVSRKVQGGPPIKVSLSKMVLDPSAVGSTQDSVPVSSSTNSNAASGSGTGSPTGSTTGM